MLWENNFLLGFIGFFHVLCPLEKAFNSHDWSRQNFSLQYQSNIKKTIDKNQKNYQLGIIDWSNTKFLEITW